ncbi:MAG: EFR1 family ferrodoxin [Solirubrobacterales bacterium]
MALHAETPEWRDTVKVLIVYFSATGNTKYGAELVQFGIEQTEGTRCDCVPIHRFAGGMVFEYDLIGFACPVFAYKPPLNMLALIQNLPDGGGKPCFTFVSYAGALSNTFWILKTELEKRNYVCLAQKEMLAQGSWTTERAPGRIHYENEPSAVTQKGIIAFGKELPGVFERYINSGHMEASPAFRLGFRHIISWFYNDFILEHFFTTKVNLDRCTNCGLCVKRCPTGRMHYDRFPNPKGKCVGCYQCINRCPENAVEGWLTKGKIRYKGLSPAIKLLKKDSDETR